MIKQWETRPRNLPIIILALITACLDLAGLATADELLRCPDTVMVNDEVRAPAGWIATNGVNERAFSAISVLNMGNTGQEYDLHPDKEEQDGPLLTQIWELAGYRDLPIILRCHYQNTVSTIEGVLPAGLATCSQTFVYDPASTSGEALPSPVTMECR